MRTGEIIVKDRFARFFQLSSSCTFLKKRNLQRVRFDSQLSAKSFLQNLYITHYDLRRWINQLGVISIKRDDVFNYVAELLVKGRLQFFELSLVRSTFISDSDGNKYTFSNLPQLGLYQSNAELKQVFISSKIQAKKIISNLNVSDDYWGKVLLDNEEYSDSINPQQQVINLLIDGSLYVYQVPEKSSPPVSENNYEDKDKHNLKKSSLGPHGNEEDSITKTLYFLLSS